ncbi:MAG: hypothetical protein HRK26_04685 [Rickettsiaceae bacterium H1]|nr:hypothetical protein [Rickettsiaceae bacterium H1]
MCFAADRGNEKFVKALINGGAGVNLESTEGWTALMSASWAYGNCQYIN